MKKICIALFMVAALTVSLSTSAQANKKEGAKAKTEQAEKKSGEAKACCAEKKDKACCADKADKKEKDCCKEEGKAKSSANKETAATETKSCGKKK
ncbi:hypothetical protein AGMMS50239_03530 [Bacteroidia bacterium]|nr:hypothetical protein AGMMS50239_03530 [Bacteroidia bacterium]